GLGGEPLGQDPLGGLNGQLGGGGLHGGGGLGLGQGDAALGEGLATGDALGQAFLSLGFEPLGLGRGGLQHVLGLGLGLGPLGLQVGEHGLGLGAQPGGLVEVGLVGGGLGVQRA